MKSYSDADPIPGVFNTAFWVATVMRISGYLVVLRYEGFGEDGTKDFKFTMMTLPSWLK